MNLKVKLKKFLNFTDISSPHKICSPWKITVGWRKERVTFRGIHLASLRESEVSLTCVANLTPWRKGQWALHHVHCTCPRNCCLSCHCALSHWGRRPQVPGGSRGVCISAMPHLALPSLHSRWFSSLRYGGMEALGCWAPCNESFLWAK